MDLKMHNSYPLLRRESKLLETFSAEAARRSDGQLRISVLHDGASGLKDDDAIGANAQKIELAHLRSSILQNARPVLRGAYVMGSPRTINEHMRAMPALEQIYSEVLAEQGLHAIAFLPSALFYVAVFSRGGPVRTLDELRRKKLRVFSLDLEPTFRSLGVDAVFIPQPELYDALNAGTVNATVYPACHTTWSVPLWRVTDHASFLFVESLPPNALVIRSDIWEACSEPQRRALTEAGEAIHAPYLRLSLNDADDTAARETLKAGGLTWLDDFSSHDQRLFHDAADTTWRELAQKAGPRGMENYHRVIAAMGRAEQRSSQSSNTPVMA